MLPKFFWSTTHKTRAPKQVYTVLGLQDPKFQIFTTQVL